jgi:hypothetical protein
MPTCVLDVDGLPARMMLIGCTLTVAVALPAPPDPVAVSVIGKEPVWFTAAA